MSAQVPHSSKQRRPSITGIPPLSTNIQIKSHPSPPPPQPTASTTAPIKAILKDDPKQKKKSSRQKAAAVKTEAIEDEPVTLFSHLAQFRKKACDKGAFPANVHTAVITFALRSASFQNLGGNRRCHEMMAAFKEAIHDYRATDDVAISRHMDAYLKPMISFIVEARPMAISMSNAVRALRHRISILSVDIDETQAKEQIASFLTHFNEQRLKLADDLIVSYTLPKLLSDSKQDCILTFSHSRVVRNLLIEANKDENKNFQVIIVESRPFIHEAKRLLEELVAANIKCTYIPINAVGYIITKVTKCIIGAAGFFANGSLLSRVGTASVCSLCHTHNVPVIVLCETIKFSERSQIDSFVFNEIGNPDSLVHTHQRHSENGTENILKDWRSVGTLKLLNILYDVTPAEYITMVVSEVGALPVTSIPVVIREYNSTIQSNILK